jgi:hypothetical protein
MGIPPGEVSSIGRTALGTVTMSRCGNGLQEWHDLHEGLSARWFWQHAYHSTDRQTAGVCWSTCPILVYSFCMKVQNYSLKYLHPAHASIWRWIFLLHAVACIYAFIILVIDSEPSSVGFTINHRGSTPNLNSKPTN